MSTVAEPRQTNLERLQPDRGPQRLVIDDADWQTYEKFLDAIGERRFRVTYDRGRLEIMAPLWNHEWWKHRIGFVLPLLGAVLGIKVQGGGSTTCKREDLARGLEPDGLFYVRNAARMTGLRQLDLTRDPAPDLVLEVDITSSCLDRMDIYAALGVAEVWRWENGSIQVDRLTAEGRYEPCDHSPSFPSLPLAEFVRFLEQTQHLTDSELILPFQEWAREHVLPGHQAGGNGARE